MSATCGDFGGTLDSGAPCGRPAGWGTDSDAGPCRDHPHPSPFDFVRHPKRRAYLAALVETGGNVKRAAEIAGVNRTTPYTDQWREDPEFAAALPIAKRLGADALEAEAIRRARDGVEEPVGWYKGQPGGYVTRYSDTLLIFLLKGAKPSKYQDRMELSGELETTPQQVHIYLPDNRRDDELPASVRDRMAGAGGNGDRR